MYKIVTKLILRGKKMRPIIGLTTFIETNEKHRSFNSTNDNYIRSILMAGGTPVLIPVTTCDESLEDYIKLLDGIIFTGGGDLSPLYFGENPIRQINSISEERDEYELKLFKKAYNTNIPILGICRGMQLINVALKGTLYQDIYAQVPNALGHSPKNIEPHVLYHSVKIEKDSILFKIYEDYNINVNSYHHQSVKELGEGMKVSALSQDGIIEAMENASPNGQCIIGVQWHPEGLVAKHEEALELFNYFVEKCTEKN